MSDLFRKEVTEDRLTEIGVPLRITTRWMKVFTVFFVLFAFLLAGTIYYGNYARKAAVQGVLLPDKGIIKINSPREGIIKEIYVEEGQYVNKDDPLFIIDIRAESIGGNTIKSLHENFTARQQLIRNKLRLLEKIEIADEATLRQNILIKEQEIEFSKNEITENRKYIDFLKQILNRYKDLVTRKLTSIVARENAEKDLIDATLRAISQKRALAIFQSELAQLQTELDVLSEKQANERTSLQQDILDLEQQITELDNQMAILIRAPETGIVTRVTSTIGSAADIDIVLLSLVPDGAILEAFLYIPSRDAGFITVGMEILLRYEAYPYQKFGLHKARVATISQASVVNEELPFPISGNQNEPLYVVTAMLEKPFIITSGEKRPLQIGAKFQADLIMEEQRIWEWLLGPLRTLRPKT